MKLLTLKTKQIKDLIAVRFGEKLTREGYLYKKTDNQFVCASGDYSFIFNMLLTSWSGHDSIEVRLYISQHEIENVFERIIGKSHRLTIGNSIERISKSPDGRKVVNGDMSIIIEHDKDVETAIEILERYYFETAKPYFKLYNNLDAIHDIVNNPPFDHCPAHVGGSLDERCMKGLIVAKLVNCPQYDQLTAIYDGAIKKTMDPESVENYHKVKDYLKHSLSNT